MKYQSNNNPVEIIKAGVIGYPIAHSLSPKIHNYFLEKYQINGSYQAIEIIPENLSSHVESLVDQNFKGFNVTIPFKEKIFNLCHEFDETAKIIKAVNTVLIKDKKLIGFNSDAQGFINNIFDKQPNFSLTKKNIFVIGAGGASRAIIFGLIKQKVSNIFITNRNQNKVENLINDFQEISKINQVNLVHLTAKQFEENLSICDLLINSTSLGMHNQPALHINLNHLNYHSIVYDIVYKPLITNLLQQSIDRGNPIITGIGMLIKQALVGFNLWYGILVKDIKDLELMLTSNNI